MQSPSCPRNGLRRPCGIEGLTFQIQNGERVILWPELAAEAKLLLMPKWEDRGKK